MEYRRRLTASEIAKALGGHRSGKGYQARCPAHDDQTPSLSLTDGADGKILVKCHAGCSQDEVIKALRDRGLWPSASDRPRRSLTRNNPSEAEKSTHAFKLWSECRPIPGTPAERYLLGRGLTLAPPDVLRFHPSLKHPSGAVLPGLVGLITKGDDNSPVGITRTFLTPDGAEKARVTPNKMMLGQVRGGAVRLAPATDTLMIGEGLETCLSVLQETGDPVWAALSASGLKALELPKSIQSVAILADGDATGEAAAQAAAKRLRVRVRAVRIVRAPPGTDFNDLLLRQTRKS